ncbi:MAG TPA: hypothetical protein VF359_00270 [Anaerolineales bacterium]
MSNEKNWFKWHKGLARSSCENGVQPWPARPVFSLIRPVPRPVPKSGAFRHIPFVNNQESTIQK